MENRDKARYDGSRGYREFGKPRLELRTAECAAIEAEDAALKGGA
jgi:hypothetical protein